MLSRAVTLFFTAALLGAPAASAAPPGFDTNSAVARAGQYQAVVGRDCWGLPRMHGRTDADAAFALGYAFAEDDHRARQAGRAGHCHERCP